MNQSTKQSLISFTSRKGKNKTTKNQKKNNNTRVISHVLIRHIHVLLFLELSTTNPGFIQRSCNIYTIYAGFTPRILALHHELWLYIYTTNLPYLYITYFGCYNTYVGYNITYFRPSKSNHEPYIMYMY